MYLSKNPMVLIVLFSLLPSVSAQPPFPYYLEGYAFINNQPVPPGTLITAVDPDGIICEYCNFTTIDESGRYVLVISGDDPSTIEDEGAVDNDTIIFFINNIQANQILIWHPGKSNYEFNLSAEIKCDIETFELYIETNSMTYLQNSIIHIFGYLLNSSCEPVHDVNVSIIIQNVTEKLFQTNVTTNLTGEFNLSIPVLNMNVGNYSIVAVFENITFTSNFIVTKCVDEDGDGFNQSNKFYDCGIVDCNDYNPNIHPGAKEVCDGIDNDCDNNTDENLIRDCSLNHLGNCAIGTEVCINGIWSGCPEPQNEVCGDGDEDCDGEIDEGLNCGISSGGGSSYRSSATATPCEELWTCTEWSECINGTQRRTCNEINKCGTIRNKPDEVRKCNISFVKGKTIICASGARVCINNILKECENGIKWVDIKECEFGCEQDRCKKKEKVNITKQIDITGAVGFDSTTITGITIIILLLILILLLKKK